jgi:transcriptional regulator with XRE-family HTH domain
MDTITFPDFDGYQTIGERIRIIRKHLGLRQGDLARIMEVTSAFISSIERSGNSPKLDTVYKFSKALNCAPSLLVFGRESLDEASEKYYEDPDDPDAGFFPKLPKYPVWTLKDIANICESLTPKARAKVYDYALDLYLLEKYRQEYFDDISNQHKEE